jgi:hypothetical protein
MGILGYGTVKHNGVSPREERLVPRYFWSGRLNGSPWPELAAAGDAAGTS